jgi:hypothetical protein
MVRSGDASVTHRASTSHQSANDLLNEVEARQQELPMSLAWFRRKRLLGDGPPFIRISNRVFYRRRDLRAWITGRAQGARK